MKIFGKCILAGEHSVVRGRRAIVTPLRSRSFELEWAKSVGSGFEVEEGPFENAFTLAMEKARQTVNLPAGFWKFSVKSDIPPSAGLGSSAALSVAVARFFEQELGRKLDVFSLALRLENIFHGSSSGLDLAAVLSPGPIIFRKGAEPKRLEPAWQPHFYLSDTGLRSSTKACVAKVAALRRIDLDEKMENAVTELEKALKIPNLEGVASSLEQAADVFRAWNLIPAEVEEQITALKAKGALAVKPTGSGDGGFLLTLWAEKPTDPNLISIWNS